MPWVTQAQRIVIENEAAALAFFEAALTGLVDSVPTGLEVSAADGAGDRVDGDGLRVQRRLRRWGEERGARRIRSGCRSSWKCRSGRQLKTCICRSSARPPRRHFLLAVKENQAALYAALTATFAEVSDERRRTINEARRPEVERSEETDKGH